MEKATYKYPNQETTDCLYSSYTRCLGGFTGDNVPSLKMGGSGSKVKGAWPFAGSGAGGDSGSEGQEDQSLTRLKGTRKATPFIFTRRSSLYYDEDGDLAHEFYEETLVTKNGRKRSKLKRIQKNLIPQGIVKLNHPRIHVDFPVILCEV
ncbi:tumor suppressor candidate 2-like isoform X1 [Oncorhynchus clarkii lewisi]|uniref:Tumor suppressor candidate 2 n=2 Tax=Oncorhynchus TaxID=8016 RepID=A0AAZ3PN55_ONCTS